MDLHTPPPSYEVATGIPGAKLPYFSGAPPSAPRSNDDEVISVPITSPIFLPTHRPSPQIQSYNPISYPVTRPTPQTNVMLHRQQSRQQSFTIAKTCVCFFITLGLLVFIVFILAAVAKSGLAKPKYNSDQFAKIETNRGSSDWERDWWKNNQEMIDNIQKRNDEFLHRRRDESKLNFQIQYNNHNN